MLLGYDTQRPLAGPECSVELWNCAVQVLIEIVKLNDVVDDISTECGKIARG